MTPPLQPSPLATRLAVLPLAAMSLVAALAFAAALGACTTMRSSAKAATTTTSTSAPTPPPSAASVVVRRDSFAIASRALGESRPVNVHTPLGYDGAPNHYRRYGVLYMPDGGMDEDFPHIVRAVDSLAAAGAIPPTIVVGIPNVARRRDLTGPTRVASDSAIAPVVGGSAAFRAFIANELIPAIDARYRTTPDRAIIGESLAGLFIVETFLRQPALFTRYAAFDPSLWWNHGALVDSAAALLAAQVGSAAPRTLWYAASRDGMDSLMTTFTDVLRRDAPTSLRWHHEAHPELTHATIFAGLELPAIRFILGPTPVR